LHRYAALSVTLLFQLFFIRISVHGDRWRSRAAVLSWHIFSLFTMPGTFSQMYVQVVFAVSGRQNLMQKPWCQEVYKYISGIITAKKQKSIIVNGMPDHIHVFIGLQPSTTVSDVVRDIKCNSTNFINDRHFVRGKFKWQEGYGAFTYGQSSIKNVYDYILNQEKEHETKTFKEEYIELLNRFEIKYDERFLFDWIDTREQQ
jgi:REP element-mobilizing transposase RayT